MSCLAGCKYAGYNLRGVLCNIISLPQVHRPHLCVCGASHWRDLQSELVLIEALNQRNHTFCIYWNTPKLEWPGPKWTRRMIESV